MGGLEPPIRRAFIRTIAARELAG